jgi:hypothetical protein
MTVGGTLPAFTVSYAGIVSGDTADGIFATKSTAACTADGKTAGTYDISVTTPVLKTEATKNYTVGSSVGGTLTVSNPAPVAPGGSTDTGTKVTVPVSSGEGSVKVEATVKDGTAAVTITDAQIKEIASGKSDTGTVRMDVSSLDVSAATIPAKVIAAADKSGSTDGIQVALPTGTVTLDKTALAAVSDKGGDVTVSVDKVDNAKLTETQKAVLGVRPKPRLSWTSPSSPAARRSPPLTAAASASRFLHPEGQRGYKQARRLVHQRRRQHRTQDRLLQRKNRQI